MPDFDPKHDGWPLRDAIMRTSDPMPLASLAQKRLELGRQPRWWAPKLSPEPLLKRRIEYHIDPEQDYALTVKALETAFQIKLVKGELVCWVQPSTTDAVYSKLNATAWWALVIDDWWGDTLIEATRDEHRDFVPVAGGARYYGARIEPPDLHKPVPAEVDSFRTGAPGRPKASHLVKQEFERRAERGETASALSEEARALHAWLTTEHPTAPLESLGTIENVIRSDHRAHKIKRTD